MHASPHPDSDPLSRYAHARERLAEAPDDRAAQHQSVLSLARLGATAFALKEYERYALGRDTANEDYLALEARLHKDRYLAGDAAAGRRSAEIYKAAFEATGGTYSGINAATMGLLTGAPVSEIETLARQLLDSLSDRDGSAPSERYFHHATEAEAHWLLGDIDRAERALRDAVRFDPLNYTAHAATLRQMRLIAEAKGLDRQPLDCLGSPRPVCYAGHLWQAGEGPDEDNFKSELSDVIQRSDIGFAHGALSAGADIVMAEAFLDEGVALHLCLPGSPDQFREISVAPFGSNWITRFESCLERASSATWLPVDEAVFDADLACLCGEISMGQSILTSRIFATEPLQLLAMDTTRTTSLTAAFAKRWAQTDYPQSRIELTIAGSHSRHTVNLPTVIMETVEGCDTVRAAEIGKRLRDHRRKRPDISLFVCFESEAVMTVGVARELEPLPTSIYLSDHLAAWLALQAPHSEAVIYAGLVRTENGARHIYTLSETF